MKDFIKMVHHRTLIIVALLTIAYGNAFAEDTQVECYVGERISVNLPSYSGYNAPKLTSPDYQYVTWSSIGYTAYITGDKATGSTRARVDAVYYATGNTKPSKTFYIMVRVKAVPIRIDQSSVTLDAGQSTRLTYSATVMAGTKPESVTWESDNGCVSVNYYNGVVTGNYGGDATITATTSDGATATCRVHVNPVDPERVVIYPEYASVALDANLSLSATVYPNGAPQNVTWSYYDGNSSIATLNGNVVTGVKVGEITVKATASNGVYGLRKVTVFEPSLTLSSTSPSSGATGQSVFANPSVTFSHNISASTNYSSITLKDSKGNAVDGTTSISGKTVTYSPSHPLEPQTKYTLTIPANAVKNKWGTDYKSSVTLSFTTGDLEKLTLSATSNDKFFAVGDQISLTCSKSGATIYYTMDGTKPTESSPKYSKPIEMKRDFRLRAFATLEGYANSDLLDMEYCLTNAEIVSKFPNEEMLSVYKDVNPNVRFSNRIKASSKIESIALQPASGDKIPCEIIVADSSVYLIPSKEFEIGTSYTVTIPADAVKTKDGESNKAYSWTFSTGDFATAISMGANELGVAIKTGESLQTWGSRYASGNAADGSVAFNTQALPETFIAQDVVTVSSGFMHHAAIKTDGSLWMWGRQYCGEFGNNSTAGAATPVKIMSGVKSVSAGGQSTAIVKSDGSLWMCGRNDFGQIGNGTYDVCKSPVKIMDEVTMAVAGWCSSFALKADGALWAWGRNDNHQLGDGTDSVRRKPVQILEDVALVEASATESALFAAIKTDGSLWIWGGDKAVPQSVATNVCSVAVGSDYVEYIKTDGSLWAYGGNSFGQLGTGNTTDSAAPVKIMEEVADVVSGGQTTMALKSDGSVWTWGRNYAGALGVESPEPSASAFAATPSCIIEGMESSALQGIRCRKDIAIVEGYMSVVEMYPVPLNAKYDQLTWESSDANVVSVDERGVISAESRGKADVTCTISDADGKSFSAVCHVFVGTEKEVEEVGMENVPAEQNLKVWGNNRTIHISGLTAGQNVAVFNTAGALLYRGEAHDQALDIPVRTADVYIVRIGNRSYKILCR